MTLFDRQAIEEFERATLAPYAMKSAESRGRSVEEKPARLRTEFQRDRDRIIHCQAFRRLEYKTQVYVTHEGDHFRTRLTHSLEVAQIARTLARSLGINADLTEAIALAHDLGHTPFGHTGERVLNELLKDEGGFEHNAQSLRVVELLEERFHDRPGLNLTWEVRAGIAQHSPAYSTPDHARYEDGLRPFLESQLVDLCDEIAYNHHDLDDAIGMGLLTVEQLREVPWVWDLWDLERGKSPGEIDPRHVRYRALGALMDRMVDDVIDTTHELLTRNAIGSPLAAREFGGLLIGFSPVMKTNHKMLREFLMAQVYRHPVTLRMQEKAARFLRELFDLYKKEPRMLPRRQQERIVEWGLSRVLADYLSGMTDRHCLEEYRSHFDPGTLGGSF